MASMAAIGSLNVPCAASASSSSGGRKSLPRSLSFSASQLSGDKISTDSVSVAPRRVRNPVIVSPKAVSDSQNSQTCLDPDASRVSLPLSLLLSFSFFFHCYSLKLVSM